MIARKYFSQRNSRELLHIEMQRQAFTELKFQFANSISATTVSKFAATYDSPFCDRWAILISAATFYEQVPIENFSS